MTEKKKRKRTPRPPLRKQNYIADWRIFRGMDSQGKLAKASGVNRETINRLESGKLPYRQWLLEKLAVALQCNPHDLIGTDPNGVPDIVKLYNALPPTRRNGAKAGELIRK